VHPKGLAGVTTSSIRSRILKDRPGRAGTAGQPGHNIVDPFEDTESPSCNLEYLIKVASHNIVDPFEDTERAGDFGFDVTARPVTTSSIRSRILKGLMSLMPVLN